MEALLQFLSKRKDGVMVLRAAMPKRDGSLMLPVTKVKVPDADPDPLVIRKVLDNMFISADTSSALEGVLRHQKAPDPYDLPQRIFRISSNTPQIRNLCGESELTGPYLLFSSGYGIKDRYPSVGGHHLRGWGEKVLPEGAGRGAGR